MNNISEQQIESNINTTVSSLHNILIDLSIIIGTALLCISILWLIINCIRYFSNKDKANGKFKYKTPLIMFALSIVPSLLPFV